LAWKLLQNLDFSEQLSACLRNEIAIDHIFLLPNHHYTHSLLLVVFAIDS